MAETAAAEALPAISIPIPPSNSRCPPKLFRGVRKRSWGKWVSEICEPKKRSRIWLGSYSTPEAAAHAYDMALYCLRGPLASSLNFPTFLPPHHPPSMSPKSVQKAAIAAGLATEQSSSSSSQLPYPTTTSVDQRSDEFRPCRSINLNEMAPDT